VPVTLVAHAIASLTELKTYLPAAGSGADDRMRLALNVATSVLERRAGERQLVTRDENITEFFSPLPNTFELRLGDWPVYSVVSVHESYSAPRAWDAGSLLVEGTDYEIVKPTGILRRLSNGVSNRRCWASGGHSVRAVVKCGYQKADGTPAEAPQRPDDLVQAGLFLAASIVKETERGSWGVSAQADSLGNVTRFMGYLPPSMAEMIALHRRYEFDAIRERMA
jgi:hypothetical protein